MLDHVECELDWVLDSPVFYGQEALHWAQHECGPSFHVSLPGPLVSCSNVLFMTAQESSLLIPAGSARKECAHRLALELQSLKTGRLGLVFEKYLEVILQHHFGASNVLCRVPVRTPYSTHPGSKTWGEFDFLLFNAELNRVEHWESSVKFYLQVEDDPSWRFYWGPGVHDRLDLKGPKIFLQQLALSSTALGLEAIPEHWRASELVKHVFAKGTIYYRWSPAGESFSERLKHIILPRGLAAEHLKSWWIQMNEVEDLRCRYPESMPALLPRRYWMTGLPETLLDNTLEPWPEFIHKLSTRAEWASARKECLHVALYSNEPKSRILTAGFIATPHFLAAKADAAKLALRPFQQG